MLDNFVKLKTLSTDTNFMLFYYPTVNKLYSSTSLLFIDYYDYYKLVCYYVNSEILNNTRKENIYDVPGCIEIKEGKGSFIMQFNSQ